MEEIHKYILRNGWKPEKSYKFKYLLENNTYDNIKKG